MLKREGQWQLQKKVFALASEFDGIVPQSLKIYRGLNRSTGTWGQKELEQQSHYSSWSSVNMGFGEGATDASCLEEDGFLMLVGSCVALPV